MKNMDYTANDITKDYEKTICLKVICIGFFERERNSNVRDWFCKKAVKLPHQSILTGLSEHQSSFKSTYNT